MNIYINTWVNADCTLGRFFVGDFQCFSLELPWSANRRGLSCIPAGTYKAIKYDSPSKGKVLLLKDVPGRSYIEIHAGNFTRQIQGCILVGDGIRLLDGDEIPDVTNSKNTLNHILSLCDEENEVSIRRSYSG